MGGIYREYKTWKICRCIVFARKPTVTRGELVREPDRRPQFMKWDMHGSRLSCKLQIAISVGAPQQESCRMLISMQGSAFYYWVPSHTIVHSRLAPRYKLISG